MNPRITLLALLVASCLSACQHDNPPESNLSFEQVTGFVISGAGEKILSTDHGLFHLDEAAGSIEPVDAPPWDRYLNHLALNSASSGSLWAATGAGALNCSNGQLLTSENSGLSGDSVLLIHFNREGTGFFSLATGLDILEGNRWRHYEGLNSLFRQYQVTGMASATDGYHYVTTGGGGVERFALDADGITGATVFDTDWTWLESNNVLTVFVEDTVQAYGTDRGAALHHSSSTKWNWQTFSVKEGLAGDTVTAITRDHVGNWWFGTTGGLSRFDGDGWSSYTMASHGLLSNHVRFLQSDPLSSAHGWSVWIAGEKGITHISDSTITHYLK